LELLRKMIELENKLFAVNKKGIIADYCDAKYGPHVRNTFDLWLADSKTPTPLVIYIHGGGFIGGDKSKYHESADLVRFLDAGVSVATINYRFMNEAPYGILGSMNDSKYFVQYVRYHAKKYNIDKNRIACSGGSAGAGTALWLAFSDDMADSDNPDPILGESTRITAAGAFATQCTYDIWQWDKIIGLPIEKSHEHLLSISHAFGFKNIESLGTPEELKIRTELDFLAKMNSTGAPFYVYNKQHGGQPANHEEINHHPNHARSLKEKADEVGLEAVVYAPEIGIVNPTGKDLVQFFLEKFNSG
jgi:hypothetical protein